MAEDKLEGFEDFDNILAEGQGAAKGGAAAAGGELDELLGKEGGAAPAGEGAGGDSELDSFFEDLSTIDDLEVSQEAAKAPPAAPAAAPMAAAAAPAAAPPAREERAARPARPARQAKAPGQPGRLRRFLTWLVLIALFGGGGYYIYTTYIAGEGKLPWPTFPSIKFEREPPPPPVVVKPPPPPPPPVEQPKPVLKPVRAPRPRGPAFSIQVATCFFDSCVKAYSTLLGQAHLPLRTQVKATETQSLELVSETAFQNLQVAQEMADRINNENRLEGHAFVLQEGSAFHLSLGEFSDLSRANVVRDTINQRYRGQVLFVHRLKALPYSLKVLTTGTFYGRAEAERALASLRAMDGNLSSAFIVPGGQ